MIEPGSAVLGIWTDLESGLGGLVARPLADPRRNAARQWLESSAAVRFHLQTRFDRPPILVALGGTGTGKSTLVNRLVGEEVTMASYRRTFTNGVVALVDREPRLPPGWLDLPARTADSEERPVRGSVGELTVVRFPHPLTERLTLVDTPDLDGDRPDHPPQADRAFRWAEAILFVVTPEKYQAASLQPYLRMAIRYRIPCLFVLNKCEEREVLLDFQDLLDRLGFGRREVFAVPRNDSTYEPPQGEGFAALARRLLEFESPAENDRTAGFRARCEDLLDRLEDRVLEPLRTLRDEIDATVRALRSYDEAGAEVDVSPLARKVNARMEEKSVLYLMGLKRMSTRAGRAARALFSVPRAMWDWASGRPEPVSEEVRTSSPPDFAALLADQFTLFQAQVFDLVGSAAAGERVEEAMGPTPESVRIDPDRAGEIAAEEIARLGEWLQSRWDSTPRDTKALEKLLEHLPGGAKIQQWTEAAPYLLVLVAAVNNAFFGPIDLLVIGGYGAATWFAEKIGNEVTAEVRKTNRRIAARWRELAREPG